MKEKKNVLVSAAQTTDLPADIVAGLPRIELTGNIRCSIEPHKGLLEYSKEAVSVDSAVGTVLVRGVELDIQQMNRSRITLCGQITDITLEDIVE